MIVEINGKLNRDWNLDLLSKVIAPATAKVNKIDIPAADGSIDLTEALGGIVRYNNRKITMQFEIRAPRIEWERLRSELFEAYNGKNVVIAFDDDADYEWHGRASIGEIVNHKSTGGIKIEVDAEPFKRTRAPIHRETIQMTSTASHVVNYNCTHSRGIVDIKLNDLRRLKVTDTSDEFSTIITLVNNEKAPQMIKGLNTFVFNLTSTDTSGSFDLLIYGGDL